VRLLSTRSGGGITIRMEAGRARLPACSPIKAHSRRSFERGYHRTGRHAATVAISSSRRHDGGGEGGENPDLKGGPHIRISSQGSGLGMDAASSSASHRAIFTTNPGAKARGPGLSMDPASAGTPAAPRAPSEPGSGNECPIWRRGGRGRPRPAGYDSAICRRVLPLTSTERAQIIFFFFRGRRQRFVREVLSDVAGGGGKFAGQTDAEDVSRALALQVPAAGGRRH